MGPAQNNKTLQREAGAVQIASDTCALPWQISFKHTR